MAKFKTLNGYLVMRASKISLTDKLRRNVLTPRRKELNRTRSTERTYSSPQKKMKIVL